MLKKINYITNLDVAHFSGGWSAMNHHVYHQLKNKLDVNLIQKVDPPYSAAKKVQSKIFRSIHLRGSFPAFTNKRLSDINKIVTSQLKPADLNFFHGATPWINVQTSLPYAIYLDVPFHSYINIYHNRSAFSKKQINAIIQKETSFLNNAKAVLFSSEWALKETKRQYNLPGTNFHVVGLGGGFNLSIQNEQRTDKYFLFVSHDFFGKGGEPAIRAFSKLRSSFPEFSLKIVGQKPPYKSLKQSGIEYLGFFDKADQQQQTKLLQLFRNAYCFLLPTSKDITPLVLIEAGIAGCPVIATKSFGIPEIVKDAITGILIDKDDIENQLYEGMLRLCDDQMLRDQFAEKARLHVNANYTWEKAGEKIIQILSVVNA